MTTLMIAPYRYIPLDRRLVTVHAQASGMTEPQRNVVDTGRLPVFGAAHTSFVPQRLQKAAIRSISMDDSP
ncbi:MAG TPA: hypothetical protein VG897_08075 [Terriglobales bacterium]|nr:hypothetical protein [Terriglobales bacterium]